MIHMMVFTAKLCYGSTKKGEVATNQSELSFVNVFRFFVYMSLL